MRVCVCEWLCALSMRERRDGCVVVCTLRISYKGKRILDGRIGAFAYISLMKKKEECHCAARCVECCSVWLKWTRVHRAIVQKQTACIMFTITISQTAAHMLLVFFTSCFAVKNDFYWEFNFILKLFNCFNDFL